MSYIGDHWAFDPYLVVALVWAAIHETGVQRLRRRSSPARALRRRWKSLLFYAGLALLLLAVDSPIAYFSRSYFFVHILQHILISFYAPALVVASAPWIPLLFAIPVRARRSLLRAVLKGRSSSLLRRFGKLVLNRWTAVVSFNIAMVAWHLPRLFDVAETSPYVHGWLMYPSFFITGVLFWLQIVPSRPYRLKASAGWQIGAVVSTNVIMFVLAMSLSIFSAASWYTVYNHVPGVTLAPFADQQIGAAILWICGDFWAVPALVYIIRRAIGDEGNLSDLLERVIHRDADPALEQLRRGY